MGDHHNYENVLNLIQTVRERLIRTYCVLISSPKLLVIRKHLFQWLQDRRIKVSILLQQRLQSIDGHIITDTNGVLPKYTQIPGKQYRVTLQHLKENKFVHNDLKQNDLLLLNSTCCHPNNIKYTFEFNKLHTNIGHNLYQTNNSSKHKKKNMNNLDMSSSANTQHSTQRIAISNAVKNQLNDLSSIINEQQQISSNSTNSNSQKRKKEEIIKLDLFDLDIIDDQNKEESMNKKKTKNNSIRFGRTNSALQDALDNLDLGDNDSSNDIKTTKETSNDEDLFDLLNDEEKSQ